MKRADYINPEKAATPEEISMHDHLMVIIRMEVMKVADQFLNIPYTEENKQKLEAEIRKAISQALKTFVTPGIAEPALTREEETEEMRRALDILRRLREVRDGNPPAAPWILPDSPQQPLDHWNWPDTYTTRDYITTDRTSTDIYRSNFIISEPGTYISTISGISVMGYNGTASNPFQTTYDINGNVWSPLEEVKKLITKQHIQKIWEKVYGGL